MGDSVISARPNRLITLGVQDAAPPTDSYISQDDQLFTHVINSAPGISVIITVRLLLPDGRINTNQFQYFPNSTRAPFQASQFLAEGFILSVTATAGASNIGQTWVNCTLSRNLPVGTFPATGAYGEILLQGYLSGNNCLTWPRGQIQGTISQQGWIRSITGTLPAAGAEISETVPVGAIWSLKSFLFTFTTGAAVANRVPHLIIDDGTNQLLNLAYASTIAASLTTQILTALGITPIVVSDGVARLNTPTNILLSAGWRIRTLTTALQAADQYTAPQYEVEEWIAG
jgi:hypothetical protein